jgi:hypothetical protein
MDEGRYAVERAVPLSVVVIGKSIGRSGEVPNDIDQMAELSRL